MKSLTYKLSVSFIFFLFSMLTISTTLNAQETKFRQQAWRYGINLGAQTNSAALGWQQLYGGIPSFQANRDSINYVDGTGMGLYVGIFGEYLSESWWGIQMRISYDSRDALILDDTKTPESSFDTKMSYLTFEPLFRVDQKLIPNLNFYAGPFLAINLNASFIYKADKDASTGSPEFEAEDMNKVTYGIQAGTAYDIRVTDFDQNSSLYIAPFVDASWLINQKGVMNGLDQNSITDVWSTGSYRFGIKVFLENREPDGLVTETTIPAKKVFVIMPTDNVIVTKNIQGYFPIHPYVFFEKGRTDIPPRYTLLSKSEAANFKEADISDFMKGDLTTKQTNIDQLMRSYYNILNIYGDRLRNNPSVNVTLRGTDPDEKAALVDATTVKKYLVDNFGINENRINIIIEPPFMPSGSEFTEEVSKNLIDDENRTVKFIFSDPEMTKPMVYTIRDESSIDNDLIFSIGANTAYKSWDITITGEGKNMYFGPYSYSSARINPAELMRFLESGKYNAKVEITDKNGFKTSENLPIKLTKEKELKNASRYLMIFNYNDANAVASYETVIRKVIVPDMATGNRVIVHGNTDIIGTEEGNRKLSLQRAEQAKLIIEDQLKLDNKQVKIETIGNGQTKTAYTFDNRYPEGRMYNRNVFVETIK